TPSRTRAVAGIFAPWPSARHATLVFLASIIAAGGCARGVKRENAQLKDENSTLSSQFAEVQGSRDQLQAKLDAANSSMSQATSRIKDLSVQLDAAKRSAAASQTRYVESYRALQAMKAKSEQDSKALANANDQVA